MKSSGAGRGASGGPGSLAEALPDANRLHEYQRQQQVIARLAEHGVEQEAARRDAARNKSVTVEVVDRIAAAVNADASVEKKAGVLVHRLKEYRPNNRSDHRAAKREREFDESDAPEARIMRFPEAARA